MNGQQGCRGGLRSEIRCIVVPGFSKEVEEQEEDPQAQIQWFRLPKCSSHISLKKDSCGKVEGDDVIQFSLTNDTCHRN